MPVTRISYRWPRDHSRGGQQNHMQHQPILEHQTALASQISSGAVPPAADD
jgi:hypothetical protein